MSISYLLSPNDYSLYSKELNANTVSTDEVNASKIITPDLELSNKGSIICDLVYFTGINWQVITPGIEIKYTSVDKFVFIEVPLISAVLPSNVATYYISQFLNSPAINFPFTFKYINLSTAFLTQSGIQSVINYKTYTTADTPIQINNLGSSNFTGGPVTFNAAVLVLVKNV
jgi:hypothetical protein